MGVIRTICCTLSAALLLACSHSTRETLALPLDSLRNGDIVFRSGLSMSSNLIMMHDGSGGAYSHVGIVCHTDSGWYVVHAVNDEHDFPGDVDRVKMEPLHCFFSPERASSGEIVHAWVSEDTAQAMTRRAMGFARDSVLFDARFDHHDHTHIYCTELIYIIYKEVGIDITEGRTTKVGTLLFPDEIIFPSDIYKNRKLKSYFKY